MKTMAERCQEMIGESIVIRGTDYGHVTEFYSIESSGHTRYIFVTDKDSKIEAASYFRFVSFNRNGVALSQSKGTFKRRTQEIKYVPTANLSNIAYSDYKGQNKRGGN